MNKCIAFVDDDEQICRYFREMAMMITVFNRLFGCQDRCLAELVDNAIKYTPEGGSLFSRSAIGDCVQKSPARLWYNKRVRRGW